MTQSEVRELKEKLEVQREDLSHFLSRAEEETRSLDADAAQDAADRCVIGMSKESLFERSSQRRALLRLIEAALRRIAEGSFGECVGCGSEIESRRLQAVPWTQFCLPCQAAIEEEVGGSVARRIAPLPPPGGARKHFARPRVERRGCESAGGKISLQSAAGGEQSSRRTFSREISSKAGGKFK
jgi:DnaK suppressor protein